MKFRYILIGFILHLICTAQGQAFWGDEQNSQTITLSKQELQTLNQEIQEVNERLKMITSQINALSEDLRYVTNSLASSLDLPNNFINPNHLQNPDAFQTQALQLGSHLREKFASVINHMSILQMQINNLSPSNKTIGKR